MNSKLDPGPTRNSFRAQIGFIFGQVSESVQTIEIPALKNISPFTLHIDHQVGYY